MSEPVESEHEYQKGCQQQYGWDDSKSKDHNNSWNSRNFKDRNNISKQHTQQRHQSKQSILLLSFDPTL
jgi:hypothetical protein